MSSTGQTGLGAKLAALIEERLALMAPARRLRLALADDIVTRYAGERPIRVLDAGAGDGLLSLAIAKRHPRWSVLGVDLRADLLDGARARARSRSLHNASFEPADLTEPLPASGFDVVLALECLSEIPDDEQALQMMAAALAPGGLLVVQVPDREWRPLLSGSAATWREQVRQGYSAEQIAAALRRSGLERVDVQPTFRTTAALAQEIRDRIKDSNLAIRAAAFPVLAAAVRLERWGITGGRPNALLAVARRPDGT
ncbi:MAG: methyltransferase domain-containing protein [Actinomycetota bacterium]